MAAAIAPATGADDRALLDAAREGAQRARAEALAEAERAVRERLDQGEYAAAREQLSQAVERLGNDTRLAELLRAIETRERERRVASAENERLAGLADQAEQALAEGNLAEALSKVFEIVARDPQHVRGRALQERIDRLRREQEVAEPGAATAATQIAGRAASAATLRPPRRPSCSGRRRPSRPADEVTAPVQVAAAAPVASAATTARRSPAVLWCRRFAVAVAVAAWLLWRALAIARRRRVRPDADPDAASDVSLRRGLRAGIAALERGDAAAAARRLREALAADPVERDGYYPCVQFGLALAAIGDCAEAELAFAASEAAGAARRGAALAAVVAARAACAGAPDASSVRLRARARRRRSEAGAGAARRAATAEDAAGRRAALGEEPRAGRAGEARRVAAA